MEIKTKIIITLITLGIIDAVIPIPIIGLMLIYIVVQKPPLIKNIVKELYDLN